MNTQDLAYGLIEQIFRSAPFIQHCGIRFIGCGDGWCEADVELKPHHMQHLGQGHAGLAATLADHCAGSAAATQLMEMMGVVTVEFKINLLRPAVGERLTCRAEVLKPGRSFSVVESTVWAVAGESRKLVAKLNATIAFVPLKG